MINSKNTISCKGGSSNTPLDSQAETVQSCPIGGLAVHVDYYRATGKIPKIKPLLDFVLGFHEGQAWARNNDDSHTIGCYKFTHSARTPNGTFVRWFWHEEEEYYQYLLNIPGTPLSAMELRDELRLIRGLHYAYAAKATRIDLAIDDYKREISYEQLDQAIQDGDIARFLTADPYPGKLRMTANGMVRESPTMYMGSKNSNKRVCHYDALAKHPIDANRIEARFKEDKAKEVVAMIVDERAPWWDKSLEDSQEVLDQIVSGFLADCVVGAIDFIKRIDKNIKRCPRLKWWSKFLERFNGCILIHVPTRVRSLEKTRQWHERQVAKTLLVFREGMGHINFILYLNDLFNKAKDRTNAYDEACIEVLKSQYNI